LNRTREDFSWARVLTGNGFEPEPARHNIDRPARPCSRHKRRAAPLGSAPTGTTNKWRIVPRRSRRQPAPSRSKTRTIPSFSLPIASSRRRRRNCPPYARSRARHQQSMRSEERKARLRQCRDDPISQRDIRRPCSDNARRKRVMARSRLSRLDRSQAVCRRKNAAPSFRSGGPLGPSRPL
jgi:hypothetical protein